MTILISFYKIQTPENYYCLTQLTQTKPQVFQNIQPYSSPAVRWRLLFFFLIIKCTHQVFEASQHGRGDDAQKEGDDVQDRGGPQQVIEVHHVLAALHICVFVVASNDLHTAGPVGGTERETAYSQATNVSNSVYPSCIQDTIKEKHTVLIYRDKWYELETQRSRVWTRKGHAERKCHPKKTCI